MKHSLTPLMVLMAVVPLLALGQTVKVSELGYDPEDSTRFIQQALDSDAKTVILDRQAGPWVTLPLKMRSNKEFILEPGVELVAKRGAYKGLRDYLFEMPYCTNVTLRGGAGSTFRMWKKDYQGPDYKHGEWRYALRIFHCVNVLVEGLAFVESGGDGIGVTGKDITIRNCVCDGNHRQGMSVFSVENLLIENCVLRNTSGTAPQAGIDFEPDHANEKLKNVVMRNCLVENNAGNGYELYLNQLNEGSGPISVTFENCRSVGNRNAVHVCGGGSRERDFVKGFIRFDNCAFHSPRNAGIAVSASPANAFDVSFSACVISNAAPGNAQAADVHVGATRLAQGPCDGLDFGDLTIYQPVMRDWFGLGLQAVGAPAKRISGRVTVVPPDGPATNVVLDADWVARNMPPANDGRPLPPQAEFPDAAAVKVVDAEPEKAVALQPVTLLMGAKYVFFAPKPGVVSFTGRQVNVVKGRPFSTKPMRVTALGPGGKPGRSWSIPIPGAQTTAFAFKAPKAGFYRLFVPKNGTRFLLETSTVPVAIDLTEDERIMAARGGKPFSLWLNVPAQKEFSVLLFGDSHNRFKAAAIDPSGRTAVANDLVKNGFFVNGAADAPAGMWRFDFARAAEPHYDWIRIHCFGVPGFLFLSPEKTFSL